MLQRSLVQAGWAGLWCSSEVSGVPLPVVRPGHPRPARAQVGLRRWIQFQAGLPPFPLSWLFSSGPPESGSRPGAWGMAGHSRVEGVDGGPLFLFQPFPSHLLPRRARPPLAAPGSHGTARPLPTASPTGTNTCFSAPSPSSPFLFLPPGFSVLLRLHSVTVSPCLSGVTAGPQSPPVPLWCPHQNFTRICTAHLDLEPRESLPDPANVCTSQRTSWSRELQEGQGFSFSV